MKKLPIILLLSMAPFKSISSEDALSLLIGQECEGVPVSVVSKVLTHESKSFYNGHAQAWPWTLNINGVGHYYANYRTALLAAVDAHRKGSRRLGVGLGQIEWVYHQHRFDGSFAQALNPRKNVKVVCEILREAWLSDKVKTWPDAISYYHRPVMDSKAKEYAKKVLAL